MKGFEISFRALSTEIYGSLISFQLCSNKYALYIESSLLSEGSFFITLGWQNLIKTLFLCLRYGRFIQCRKFIARDILVSIMTSFYSQCSKYFWKVFLKWIMKHNYSLLGACYTKTEKGLGQLRLVKRKQLFDAW